MTPTDARSAYERLGVVDAVSEPGVYALEVAVPDAADRVARAWLDTADAPLPDDYAAQLAGADRVAYVGATGRPIRARVAEHLRGDVRRAALLRAFDVVDVIGVWPGAHSGVAERDRARALSDAETVAYANGELF